jgi:hypothetical protein
LLFLEVGLNLHNSGWKTSTSKEQKTNKQTVKNERLFVKYKHIFDIILNLIFEKYDTKI